MHKNVCIQVTVVTLLLPLVVIKVVAVINTHYLGQCRTGFLKGQKTATVVSHLTALTGKKTVDKAQQKKYATVFLWL